MFSTRVCVPVRVCYYQGCNPFVHNLGEAQNIDKSVMTKKKGVYLLSLSARL